MGKSNLILKRLESASIIIQGFKLRHVHHILLSWRDVELCRKYDSFEMRYNVNGINTVDPSVLLCLLNGIYRFDVFYLRYKQAGSLCFANFKSGWKI